jgi:hypothetical protein
VGNTVTNWERIEGLCPTLHAGAGPSEAGSLVFRETLMVDVVPSLSEEARQPLSS